MKAACDKESIGFAIITKCRFVSLLSLVFPLVAFYEISLNEKGFRMTSLEKKFAANLKQLRTKLGISQSELAENSGVSLQTIWRAENNTLPQAKNIEKLAEALGVTDQDLFSDGNSSDVFIGRVDANELEKIFASVLHKTVLTIRNDQLHTELNEVLGVLNDDQLKQIIFVARAFSESSVNKKAKQQA